MLACIAASPAAVRIREQKSRNAVCAIFDYLRNDLTASTQKLERAVALDVDRSDPDPLFHLGVVMLRLAERQD